MAVTTGSGAAAFSLGTKVADVAFTPQVSPADLAAADAFLRRVGRYCAYYWAGEAPPPGHVLDALVDEGLAESEMQVCAHGVTMQAWFLPLALREG